MKNLLTKTKNKTLIVKLVFGLALLFFIGYNIWYNPVVEDFESIQLNDNYILFFIISFLLMFVNWSLESLKWQILMHRVKRLNFKSAYLSVLAGISTGIVTPNRIGNFIGRTIYLDKEIKTKATFLTFEGNIAQFTATIIMGLLGLEIFGRNRISIDTLTIELIALGLVIFAFFLYLKPTILNIRPLNRLFSKKVVEGLEFVRDTGINQKLYILLISLIRYMVYVLQYYIILIIFGVDLPVIDLLAAIAVLYLIMTIVPSILFGKLFVREASALFILSEMGISVPVILISVFILWVINLALPALVGAYVLIRK